jgi:hypothetical protein
LHAVLVRAGSSPGSPPAASSGAQPRAITLAQSLSADGKQAVQLEADSAGVRSAVRETAKKSVRKKKEAGKAAKANAKLQVGKKKTGALRGGSSKGKQKTTVAKSLTQQQQQLPALDNSTVLLVYAVEVVGDIIIQLRVRSSSGGASGSASSAGLFHSAYTHIHIARFTYYYLRILAAMCAGIVQVRQAVL